MHALRSLALLALALAAATLLHTRVAYADGSISVTVTPDSARQGDTISVSAVGMRDLKANPNVPTTYFARILVDYQVVADNVPVGHVTSGWFRTTMGFGTDCDVPAAQVPANSNRTGSVDVGVTFYAKDASGIRWVNDGGGYVHVTPKRPAGNVEFKPPPPPPPPPPLGVSIKAISPTPYKAGGAVQVQLELQGAGDALLTGTIENGGVTPIGFPSGQADGKSSEQFIEHFGPGVMATLTTGKLILRAGANKITFKLQAGGKTVTAERTISVPRSPESEPEPRPPHKLPPSPKPRR